MIDHFVISASSSVTNCPGSRSAADISKMASLCLAGSPDRSIKINPRCQLHGAKIRRTVPGNKTDKITNYRGEVCKKREEKITNVSRRLMLEREMLTAARILGDGDIKFCQEPLFHLIIVDSRLTTVLIVAVRNSI